MSKFQHFDDEQKEMLKWIVDDFGGPTMAPRLLNVIDSLLGEAIPDWESNPSAISEELRKELEVCQLALEHYDIQSMSQK